MSEDKLGSWFGGRDGQSPEEEEGKERDDNFDGRHFDMLDRDLAGADGEQEILFVAGTS